MSKFLPNLKPASSSFGRIAGVGYGHVIGYFLVFAVVAFALFGNRSKLIVEEHQGADHGEMVSHETSHGDSHHEDSHHEDEHHEQDGSKDPIHHHHVEVSPVLVIAVVTPGDLSLFQPLVFLPKQLTDEICPTSPFSEIVKPPQVA